MVDQVGTFPTQGGATALIELHYLPMLYIRVHWTLLALEALADSNCHLCFATVC